MLEALVQNDFDINIQHILRRMRSVTAHGEVVTLRDDGSLTRAAYGDVAARATRLIDGLRRLGVEEGDRVATFAWNTQEHLEAYLAIPCMGAVLHTLNIRLFEEQIAWIVNHARDRVVFIDDSLVPIFERVAPRCETIEQYVLIGRGDGGTLSPVIRYEELLAEGSEDVELPRIDGDAAASLCYTSGTTGNPRGVLYGHRSTVIHALAECLADTLDVRLSDRVLPIVPMFHANAWGLPFTCGMLGAPLIMPGRFLQAEPLAALIEDEQVTFAAAVPTIWMDMLHTLSHRPQALASIRRAICGGAAPPRALLERFEATFGVSIVQGYGMTETSPLASVGEPPPGSEGEERWRYRLKAGRVSPLVEARIVDDAGTVLPADGESAGELELRGPWIASGYYENPEATAERMDGGWLRTGDVATIDERGYITLTDRAKDVIKSGGEWISSVELENAIMAHPAVREAAVIGRSDERWSERPLACVVVEPGSYVTAEELEEHLRPRVAKWWLPDDYAFLPEIPKTSVGKFDKKVLRRRLADGELEDRVRLARAMA
jgi:fatty-acyl-CoA synthase